VRKSLRLKLFLTFLLTTLFVVAGMYLFMRWSLQRGFEELIESRQRERVENLIDSLSETYAETDSWEALGQNKPQWIHLLMQSDPRRNRPPRPWMARALLEPGNQWPPHIDSDHDRPRHYIPLELRAMLLRADKSLVFGRPELQAQLGLHPIESHGRTVGYLGLLPGRPDNHLNDIRFIEHQAQAFAWIALLMVALSAGLALLLAYVLGKPIKRIAAAAKQLAVGAYSIRLPVESADELGQLARDFNDMAAALEQSELTRRRWVADISHELRTPLAVLQGELEALQDGIRPLDAQALESLLADVLRLNRLTDDLYQLALSDQGALSYRKNDIDPLQVLTGDLAALLPAFQQKHISVELHDKTQRNLLLHADPDRLSQLFRNILNNSVNYTDPDGKLEIGVTIRGEKHLLIEFSDSAPGVSEADRLHLFERFYRVEGSRSRYYGGAGLGLAICSNIVAAHNGSISAHPSSLGGLAIRIELPIQPQ